jgi:hypothetical protein
MRSALLLFGNPSTFEFCFPSAKTHILDVYHPDVFLCTNDEKEKMLELYHPVKHYIESQEAILEHAKELRRNKFGEWKYDLLKDKDLSSTFKSLACNQLKDNYEFINLFRYDVVMGGRFDVKYSYIQPIGEVKESVFYIPQVDARLESPKNGLTYFGYSAQFFWCSSATADKIFGQTLFGERDYVKEMDFQVNDEPERLLKFVCDANGIHPEYVDVKMMIIKGTSDKPLAFDFGSLDRFPEYKGEA